MTVTLKILAAVAASTVVLAGCSSTETKNNYVDTVNEIQNSALTAFNTATSATPSNQQELVDQLEAGEEALGDAVAQLTAVDVPSEVEGHHPALTDGIDDLRQLFADVAKTAAKGSTSETLDAVSTLSSKGSEIGGRIDGAITRINDSLGAT